MVYTIFLLLSNVFLKEYQSPKAALLLCASPYPRRLMVLGKYVFCLVLYAASSLIYWINTQIFPELGRFHWEMAVLIFFMVTIFYSLYIPLECGSLYSPKRGCYPALYRTSAPDAFLRRTPICQPGSTGDICLFICLLLRACRFIIGRHLCLPVQTLLCMKAYCLFPRATSQADMLACPFGDCCEGIIPRCLQRC